MRDVMLSVLDEELKDCVIYESGFISMKKLPKLGEYIKTIYFMDKNINSETETFEVVEIIHHYLDDMSDINFTEIILKVK